MSSGAAELLREWFSFAGPGIKVLMRTTLGMIVLGIGLTGLSFYIGGTWAALLTLVLCAVVGVFVAIKRAVLSMLKAAIIKVKVGERAVGLIFDRLPLQSAQKLPLAQAEGLLRGAVRQILEERAEKTGFRAWLARSAQVRAFDLAEAVTLAEFRSSAHDGIDLALARERLMTNAQNQIIARIDAMLLSVTAVMVTLLALVSLGAAYMISLH